MRRVACWAQRVVALISIVVTVLSIARADASPELSDQSASASGFAALHGIVDSARNPDLHWADFTPYKPEVAKLYESNGYSLLWVQHGRLRPQALAVISLLQNANNK